ncbi:penicillin-binding protein 1C [Cellvibrio zantedeschiae]|uniref:peptidoglycan glycosyltransferase n=1 Tax=Cellvibrio zantedeschiae TaxID=1237077 RepID=A0ABQ3BBY8_9GAMM|nr:penicillin-binding protein 1C [Cellvibrio zantedeschiae]GGY83374.1 penicillin-binding protein 1C [Cellvibrio zantedeschiae]
MRLTRKLRYSLIALVLIVLLLGAIRLWPRPTLAQQIPSSQAFLAENGELLRLTLANDEQYRVWTPLSEIAPQLPKAVLLYEDRWFYWHLGVNPQAVVRAAFRTYSGGQQQGGSTITMQLARLFYGLNTKSPSGKFQQMALAIWLEMRYSKREILEAYLNLAPYGSNVQGAGAASLIYFGKTAKQLSISEALTLAVIPQQPNRRAGNNALQVSLNAPKERLLKRWLEHYPLEESQARIAHLPVRFHRIQDLPFRAPHFVDMLLQEPVNQQPNRPAQVHTSLNLGLQNLVERQTRQYLQEVGSKGIQNAAALLLDPKTMEVKAWLGSANYFNAEIDGQVNGVTAKRSPGSTLKPFIYALGMDQGILHPASILKDAPTDFGPYTPENFDNQFRGPITAENALIHSRNIPAVWTASQLRSPSLYNFLSMAGISQLKSESHYGLALVLGGGEVSMEELTGLYAMLANGGRLQTIQYLKPKHLAAQTKQTTGTQLISPEASFITLDMLSHNPRPGEDSAYNLQSGWSAAWKTGTSWGFRDAWSVGVVGPYVLAVWIGNFDSRGNPAFVGVDAAAPLFFRIADGLYLHKPENIPAPRPPAGVSQVSVCSASGDLPNAWCQLTHKTWYIPGKSPIKVSQLHQPVAISLKTGQALCPPYQPEQVRMEVMEFWSSDMQKLFRQAGLPRRSPPKCQQGFQTQAPEITSPVRHVAYQLRASQPDVTIPLQAKAAAQVRTLFWFDDNRYIGSTDPLTALAYRPSDSGIHNIRVVDDQGQVAEREMTVDWIGGE